MDPLDLLLGPLVGWLVGRRTDSADLLRRARNLQDNPFACLGRTVSTSTLLAFVAEHELTPWLGLKPPPSDQPWPDGPKAIRRAIAKRRAAAKRQIEAADPKLAAISRLRRALRAAEAKLRLATADRDRTDR